MAGKDKARPPHRGRLQAQGPDIQVDRGNVSRSWERHDPHPADEAQRQLTEIESHLKSEERRIREVGFRQARRFIDNAKKCGGVGPVAPTFPAQKSHEHPHARVDIEVKVGRAFVP